VAQGIPPEVDAGTRVIVKVHVSCAHGCRLGGSPVHLIAGNVLLPAVLEEVAEGSTDEAGPPDHVAELAAIVPSLIGTFAWSVALPPSEVDGVVHEETTTPLEFTTVPHKTSMAVWDVRSPAAAGTCITAKVGLRCTVGCRLTGQRVDVLDESGARVGDARLGGTPWAGTDALYWGDLQLATPTAEGLATRHATFEADGMELPHEVSSVSFTFWTMPPPEHRVAITVVDSRTGAGLPDVEVRLGLCMAMTDGQGVVGLDMPGGRYELSIRTDGFTAPPRLLEVAENIAVRIEAVACPTMAQRAETLTSFEGYPWG
jgi:hypothetical protein